MELLTTITDRAAIVRFLEESTGLFADYAGAPTFNYRIGDYTVLRNGHIRVADEKADAEMIERLRESGLVAAENTSAGIEAEIADDVTARVNLINLLASKGALINKAIGQPNAFFVSTALIRNLKEKNPANLSELQTVLVRSGGEKALRGITFTATKVLFTGFPEDRTDEEKAAYRDFADGLVKACEKAAWVKADPVKTTNERYTFRIWMNSIDMDGAKHAKTRRILMQRLDGNTAFRTEAQREKAMRLRRKKKEEAKHEPKHDPAAEPEFIVLG
ncbi:MAG: hypothetical protein ACI4OJ_13470 [Lachnospiraceae bacterium]